MVGDKMNNPVKVCFICPKAYPLFNPQIGGVFGGVEVDLYILSNALAGDKGLSISFVVGDYGQSDHEQVGGITFYKSLKPGSKSLLAPLEIWRAMKRSDADVYMLENMSAGLILLWFFCVLNRKKYIFRTANAGSCDGTFLSRHRLTSFFYRIATQKATVLITQNQSDLVNIEKIYGSRAIVIPNAHRLDGKLQKRDDYILWVARSAVVKNPYMFVRLAGSMPDYRFVMVCPQAFRDKNYVKLKQAAAEVKNLEFIDGISFAETDRYFAKARVFVSTSDSEGFPNTFIQAAKAGVPIVSYKANPDAFLDAYDCGRCAWGDYGKLVDMVKQVTDDEQLNTKLGMNGIEYVSQRHNIEKIMPLYADIFKKVTGYGN